MKKRIGLLVALGLLGAQFSAADAPSLPNPVLTALDSGVDDERAVSLALGIDDLDVQVEIVGNVAETTLTAHFANSTDSDLEGTFTLQMPDGAVVTGYALDVDKQMIDGVLMPAVRARLEFEEKLRQGIDPGVAEVRHGNLFSTRVYPIIGGAGRTIRVRFASPVTPTRGYVLPLASAASIAQVKFAVRMRKADAAPALAWPVGARSEWRRDGGDLVNDVSLEDQALEGELAIAAAASDGRAFVTRHASGRRFVELRDVASGPPAAAPPAPRSLRIYWDRSSSRRDDALDREHEFLQRYLAATGVTQVQVVAFNSSGPTVSTPPDAAQVMRFLRNLDYRGATSFAVLSEIRSTSAEQCLLFSDGIATVDSRPELHPGCPLQVITSAPDADLGYLGMLARANGGVVISLARVDIDAGLRLLQTPAPRIVEARGDDGEALRFVSYEAGPRGWAAVVEAPVHGDVILRICGAEADAIIERRYALLDNQGPFSGAGALWAANRVLELAGDAEREPEVRDLARRFSVASPALSFVVLESPDDYLEAGIAPPASYPRELMEEYLESKRDADEQAAERKSEWLEDLIDEWNGQQEWWKARYGRSHSNEKLESVVAAAPSAGGATGQLADRPAAEALQRTSPAPRYSRRYVGGGFDGGEIEEVVVTGLRTSKTGPTISLALEPWNLDKPYLEALEAVDAADPGEYARELEAQEARYGSMPAFYFDVAEWLYRHERLPEAIEMLLSALEIPAQDTQTLVVVADRLNRYGAIDRAVWAYEQVRRLEPHRPQPTRNLALALAQRATSARGAGARADLERAMALLTELIMTPVDEEYAGIELVALTDANEIIPRLRAAGSGKPGLDPRLVALLDVDLRVVIEWNTPGTDMDLWVDQPDGERSIYSNPLTHIGGQLSNDMTSGYGPEQYLLRRAINGEYAIKIDVYAADAINPNGATMVTAHLTRNYGRRNSQTETMELELKPDEEGEMLVGRFRVGR